MFRWRGVDRKQLAGRLQGYCGRPASSLGMAGTQGGGSLVASPSIRYNRTRRSSMSYYEENNRQSSQYNLQVSHYPVKGLKVRETFYAGCGEDWSPGQHDWPGSRQNMEE